MNLGFLFSNFFCNPCLKHDEFIDFFLRELETIEYSFDTVSQRLRESAYLTKGVWITLIDWRGQCEEMFMAGAVATSKIAQSDTPDNMMALLTALRAVGPTAAVS